MKRSSRSRAWLTALIMALAGLLAWTASPAWAAQYTAISGQGSSWAGAAVSQWVADVAARGVTVNYNPNGSSLGRDAFARRIDAAFAVSEIPYTGDTADPRDTTVPNFAYGMMPMVAGGTAFMYHLEVNGGLFRDLKLSQDAAAKIFTGQVTRWNDPAIAADNPGVNLPDQQITVVVRSEGSGATAQFTLWLLRQFPSYYQRLCQVTGQCDGQHATSYYPTSNLPNFISQSGSLGVTQYTVNTPYTISYDEYAYPQQFNFPSVQLKNAAGFYTLPTDTAVAVALTQAKINTDASSPEYLTQDLTNVYGYQDPRTYPLSAYSYFMVPTQTTSLVDDAKGATLGYFSVYSLCEGQRTMGTLGYSPLPMNLVLAAMDQVRKVPGVDADTVAKMDAVKASALAANGANPCNNPTFKPGDDPSHNVLVDTAPFPAGCDAACQAPWRKAGSGIGVSGPSYGSGQTDAGQGAGQSGSPQGGDPNGAPVPIEGAADAPAQDCDPDTGVCTDAGASVSASGEKATPVSTVLPGQHGWAGPQTLLVLSSLGAAAVLFGPPLAVEALRRRRR